MLHLYLVDHFDPLEKLLKGQANATKFDHREKTLLYGLNVWIIYVIGEGKRKELIKILKKSPLRFDSYIFEFYEGTFSRVIVTSSVNT